MRPFFRYVKARITGQDPHEILRRKHFVTQSFHSSWFSRFWPSRSSQKQSFHGQGINCDKAAHEAQQGKSSNNPDTDFSLSLPLQGVHDSMDDEILPVRTLHVFESRGSLQTQLGEFKNVKEQV